MGRFYFMYVNCLLYKWLYANVFNAEKWPPGQFSTRVKIFFVTVLSINKLSWTYRNSWPELKMTKNNWIHCFDITTKVMFVKYRAYTNIYINTPPPPTSGYCMRPLVGQRPWVATARLTLWGSIASELVYIAHEKRQNLFWLIDRECWKMHDVKTLSSKKMM